MRPWEDGIRIMLQKDDRLSLSCYDIILSPSVENVLWRECYQRRNIVEGETRNSAIGICNQRNSLWRYPCRKQFPHYCSSYVLQCFEDIYDLDNRYDIDKLTHFVLTVRKNYRDVPYHNWRHGFTVAHTMYCLIKVSARFFNTHGSLV